VPAAAFALLFAFAAGGRVAPSAEAADAPPARPRPNVLWLTAEDLGVELGCYGNKLAHTPNLDRFAAQGVLYQNAFTAAPVCSPSRSAFMTGMYQTTIGAQHHRSHRGDGYRLPDGVRLITDHFRAAGYFTANVTTPAPGIKGTGKTDFNFKAERPFDGSDWSQRQPGQPFFAQVNFSETHRTFQKSKSHPVDPDQVVLPPYYPNHPLARADWAMYLESMANLDQKVGAVLKRLDDEGLAANTIVFFFGDNGQAHVRGKQWLYDGGIHVPLLVRIPAALRPAGFRPGTTSADLVSAIDFSATCLALCGIERPAKMQGQPFLGPEARPREFIVAARDRCDETADCIRCIRTARFKYIRNFFPDRPYTQPNKYKEQQYPVLGLMKELHAAGKLNAEQSLFMAAMRPAEELYDLSTDPHEIRNLAADPQHAQTLAELRSKLEAWMRATGDPGPAPEGLRAAN
jgi:arylsulfatase A-like enzyme